MTTRIAPDPNSKATYLFNAEVGFIPTEYSRRVLPHLNSTPSTEALPSSPSLESMPNVNLPSVGASPSLPALPSSSSLPVQPTLVEQAINKALKNPCIFFDGNYVKQFDFLHIDYPAKVEYNGLNYQCARAAIEAQKFTHTPMLMEKFTNLNAADVPSITMSISPSVMKKLTDEEKIHYEVQLAKFSQNPDLSKRLLLTADAHLVSHALLPYCSEHGLLWTDGYDGKGQNKSGQILMQIRKELGGIGVVAKPDDFEALLTKFKESRS